MVYTAQQPISQINSFLTFPLGVSRHADSFRILWAGFEISVSNINLHPNKVVVVEGVGDSSISGYFFDSFGLELTITIDLLIDWLIDSA